MSVEANVAAAKRVFDVFNTGDVAILDEICSSDIVTHDPAEQEDVRGIEAHKERVRMYRAAMPDLEVTLEDIFADGDEVCSRWSVRATNTGELMGMPATGKSVAFTGMTIDRFDGDGKIVETWDQWDNAGFMTQLGLAPEAVTQG